MKWHDRIQVILNTLAAKFPSWVADDSGSPSPRYKLNEMFAQQVCFEFGPNYGLKRADNGRPISSENLAMKDGDKLFAWAWENKHDGTVDNMPDAEDITGQVFVKVDPINHLNVPSENPNPEEPGEGEPTEVPASLDIGAILVALDASTSASSILAAQVKHLTGEITKLNKNGVKLRW